MAAFFIFVRCNMKKVLIITYYWPPSGGAGVQRWLKFAKYLPEFGWEPVILTVDPEKAAYPQKDFSLLQDISPDLKVFHTSTFELYSLYSKLSPKGEIPYGGFANEDKPGIFQKLSRFVRGNFFIPDPRKGWNRFALKKALELIRSCAIDTVITTGTPHSTHLIGLALKRKTGVSWFADFRDPWTDAYYYDMFYQTAIARSIDKQLEKNVLTVCDKIIVVSRGMQRMFAAKLDPKHQSKIHVLTNGFDPRDFETLEFVQTPVFSIVYTGTLTPQYPLDSLFSILNSVKQEGTEIRVDFYGKVAPEVLEKISLLKLDDCIKYHGYLPHNELVTAYKSADCLLLVVPDFARNEGILTGKIFEYLAVGKPILVFCAEGNEVVDIVESTGSGKAFRYADNLNAEKYVRGLLRDKNNINLLGRKKETEKYSRYEIAKQLADLLNH